MITVESLYPGWLTILLEFLSSGGWIPVAVTALGGTIIFSLRLRKRRLEALENLDSFFDAGNFDPLTQSVPGLGGGQGVLKTADLPISTTISSIDEIPPCLVWAGETPSPIKGNEICIDRKEMIIGSDQSQSTIAIRSEGVRPSMQVHRHGGPVTIADLGSESGTWVNYAPVSSKGLVLNDGDLVQIGSMAFRYRISRVK
jgi:hypothetical protein